MGVEAIGGLRELGEDWGIEGLGVMGDYGSTMTAAIMEGWMSQW